MCYRERLNFLTCGCQIKSTSLCPSFLRFEYKQCGAPIKRRDVPITEFVTIPWRRCRYVEGDDIAVAALCPECNEEERVKDGKGKNRGGRDYREYILGRDAFYTNEGKDGMGNRTHTSKGGKGKRNGRDGEVKNGQLVKRRIEGVTWQYDGYYVVR